MNNKNNWFVPYLPISKGVEVTSYVDGKEYGLALFKELYKAKNYVLLTGLHFMADYQLVRPSKNKSSNLASILKRISSSVRVFLLVNQFYADEGRIRQQKILNKYDFRSRFRDFLLTKGGVDSYLEETYELFESLKDFKNIYCRTAIHPHYLFGTNHQKTVVIDGRIAFLGGIDLTYVDGDRWDTPSHRRKYRASNRPEQYWHDVHMSLKGPAVEIVRSNFRQRWEGENLHTLYKRLSGVYKGTIDIRQDKNPPKLPVWKTPEFNTYPSSLGDWKRKKNIQYSNRSITQVDISTMEIPIVQIVRSMPFRGNRYWNKYKPSWNLDSRQWERSAKDAYLVGIAAAKNYIYIENQWITDEDIWSELLESAKRNKKNPNFRIILVVPYEQLTAARFGADQDGGLLLKGNIEKIVQVLGERFGMYSLLSWKPGLDRLERPQIYVHSKILIVDDKWALIGSANAGGISLEGIRPEHDKPDSELSAIVYSKKIASKLRYKIWSEHLEYPVGHSYSSYDADKFRYNSLMSRKRIRFCPIYKSPPFSKFLTTTLRDIQSGSRIEVYPIDPTRPFPLSILPSFSLFITFPVPAANWGVFPMYRWVLRIGNIKPNGTFEGLIGKNYKLLKIGQNGTTFEFGFHDSTVVGKATADAVQRWFIANNRNVQWGQVKCRVVLVPINERINISRYTSTDYLKYPQFVISREFLLLEHKFAESNY